MPDSDEDPMVPMTVRVRTSIRKRMRLAAVEDDTDLQTVVDQALAEWLRQHGH